MSETTHQPLSFGEQISRELQRSSFRRVRIAARESETVLSILIPEDWNEVSRNTSADGSGMSRLKSFGPSDVPRIEFFQAKQEFEIDLEDWLRLQADLLSLTVTASQTVESEHGEVAHAAATRANGDHFRLVAAGDGPALFLVVIWAGANVPPPIEDVLGLIAGSLIFRKHSGRATREEIGLYTAKDDQFQVAYPTSWKPAPAVGKRPGVEFRIASANDTLAYAHVVFDPSKPGRPEGLRAAFEDAIDEVRKARVQVGKLERIPPPASGGRVERVIGDVRLPGGDGQIFVALSPHGTGWLRAEVLAPRQDTNPLVWMRAKRFFEILCGSLEKEKQDAPDGKPPG